MNTCSQRFYSVVRCTGLFVAVLGCVLNLLCYGVAAAQATEQPSRQTTFGDVRFALPEGWKSVEKTSGTSKILVIVPPDFSDKEKFAIVFLPGQDLKDGDFKESFAKLGKEGLSANEHLVQSTELPSRKTPAGYDLISRLQVVEDEAGHQSMRLLFAANPNKRLEMLMVLVPVK